MHRTHKYTNDICYICLPGTRASCSSRLKTRKKNENYKDMCSMCKFNKHFVLAKRNRQYAIKSKTRPGGSDRARIMCASVLCCVCLAWLMFLVTHNTLNDGYRAIPQQKECERMREGAKQWAHSDFVWCFVLFLRCLHKCFWDSLKSIIRKPYIHSRIRWI